jgi:hypothetical protein
MNTPSAILAVNSLDRYTINKPGTLASLDNALQDLYYGNSGPPLELPVPPGNNFSLTYPGALIYGYIKTITASQIQIEYKVPTVVPPVGSNLGNGFLPMVNVTRNILEVMIIPYGFYTPDELAAMLTVLLQTFYNGPNNVGNPNFTVTYVNSGGELDPANYNVNGNTFIFRSGNGDEFYFPDLIALRSFRSITEAQWIAILKCYRLFGITSFNSNLPVGTVGVFQQTHSPSFLYTPYIDICSQNLTKYQRVKDTDTTVNKRQSIIARIYLSGVGAPEATSSTYSLGSQPFIMTADLNSPKIIRWSPNEAVYELDFQLYDQYGDLLYWDNRYPTEFQLTLLCREGED